MKELSLKKDLSRCLDLPLAKYRDRLPMIVQSSTSDQGLKAEYPEIKGNPIRQDPFYLQDLACRTDLFFPKEDVLI